MNTRTARLTVSVRPLRQGGARLSADQLQPFTTGLLTTSREVAVLGLSLVATVGGPVFVGPLYEPRVIKATEQVWIFQGIERVGEAAYVQEWELRQFARIL